MRKETANYKWVERNIYKVGGTYRIRVGSHSLYAPTRDKARSIKRSLLHS